VAGVFVISGGEAVPEPAILDGVRQGLSELGIKPDDVQLAERANWGGYVAVFVRVGERVLYEEVDSWQQDNDVVGRGLAELIANRLQLGPRVGRQHSGLSERLAAVRA
jgi:hypothetical protein